MKASLKKIITLSLSSLILTACGGSDGGDRAPDVDSNPNTPGGPVTVPTPEVPVVDNTLDKSELTSADELELEITGLSLDGSPTLVFTVEARDGLTVYGLEASDLRASFAQLQVLNENGIEGWASLISRPEDPVCRSQADIDNSLNSCTTATEETDPAAIDDSARKVQDPVAIGKQPLLQATTESPEALVQAGDGSYQYTLATTISDPANNTAMHRVCLQFGLVAEIANGCIDFIPADLLDDSIANLATSLADDFYTTYASRQLVSEQTCNSCHDKLAFHGGGRTATDYCVTCHNPGTNDANSGNNLDLAVMVHRIHFSAELPSVADGTAYKVWGYRNSEYDFSHVSYPQKMIHCSRCHAGEEDVEFAQVQGLPAPAATITADGHNWVSKPSLPACAACHEGVTQNLKLNGEELGLDHSTFTLADNCAGCHRDRGADEPGGLQANQAHRDSPDETGRNLTIVIDGVTNTAADETPVVNFHIEDAAGTAIDLQNTDTMCADAAFALRIPYDAGSEYIARISGSGVPADLTTLGDNLFAISPSAAVPAAIDSLAVMLDWNFPSDCTDSESERARLDSVTTFVPSSATAASDRREIVSVENCNQCHQRLLTTTQKHGGLRSVNDPAACVACHSAEFATTDRTREMAVMTHGLHAAVMRETPYDIYDTERLHYPGNLADCGSCHQGDSQLLPLPVSRRPIKTTSTTYTTAIAAICAGCHDGAAAKAHMTQSGGALFDVEFEPANAVVESCDVCHRQGAIADINQAHQP